MSKLRDHDPITLDEFNGLWQRGDVDNTPLDHFRDCNNIRFAGSSSFATRHGIGISQDVALPLSNVKRFYNYPTSYANTIIALILNNDGDGEIHHIVNATTVYGPLLTIAGMTDFAFVPYAGRGYISPFTGQRDTLAPPNPLTTILVQGSGVDAGLHGYASTFVTAGGETTPSTLTNITTVAQLADPVTTGNPTDSGIGTISKLTAGEVYKWRFTYTRNGLQTSVGPESSGIVAPAAGVLVKLFAVGPFPSPDVIVNIYRTLGNGSTYYLEDTTTVASFPIFVGAVYSDAQLVTHALAPVTNDTEEEEVGLSNIPIGGATVTARKIYRTEADASQLKLLTTINDNITTEFEDNTADSSLGVNAPTTNTVFTSDKIIARGLQGEFLYVYAGDGTAARKAAGEALVGNMTIANGSAGHTDPGLHVFGFVSETVSGYLTPPGALKTFSTSAASSVSFGNVPTSGDPNTIKRHLVATKVIPSYNGNPEGYTFYFVPNATINNNSDTFLNNISFFDQDLLDDASHLFDNYSEIPAGASLSLYHGRLVLTTTYENISIGLVSAVGEPEAISQIDGIIAVTPDGNPITNAQELRDICYVYKASKTVSFIDNGDVPSSWPEVLIDNALGTPVHGIATVLDSGSSSVDFLIVCTYQGISLFNGRYITPELSWKIENYWKSLDRSLFNLIQIINAPIQKEIYIVLPNKKLLSGNYSNGFDPKKIRWTPNSSLIGFNTVAIANIDEIILGSDLY